MAAEDVNEGGDDLGLGADDGAVILDDEEAVEGGGGVLGRGGGGGVAEDVGEGVEEAWRRHEGLPVGDGDVEEGGDGVLLGGRRGGVEEVEEKVDGAGLGDVAAGVRIDLNQTLLTKTMLAYCASRCHKTTSTTAKAN